MSTEVLSERDREAAAGLPRRVVEAWAEHDADAFAAVFTEDATMILPGLYVRGRTNIRDFMARAFTEQFKGTRVTGQPFHVSVLGPDVVVLLTEGGVMEEGQTEVSPERAIRASWVAVRDDGQWRLAAYQNSPK
ncbi:SgcJ/EcaC family oxidoreductase [Saccharomonospora halophila]|uniref:SgcJ/EcaC family oxidoreductase n=1 Tax=Saccharomonospora halophila TaxID=129922 RepID=UPI000367ACEE|nr:SgcJ/EcaC family oxidoreductase [Saccharomonospora halophila]